jgi:hypothetical protein
VSLAYVFWHWPAANADRNAYETAAQRFHEALDRPGTATFRLDRAPFDTEDGAPYEDWYPVDDWAAVGALNDHAISGDRKAPHDEIAHASRKGSGAIFRRLGDGPALHEVRFAAWTPQRPERLDGVWQRQLVLGPAPEYAVLAASPVDVPAGATLTAPVLVARS